MKAGVTNVEAGDRRTGRVPGTSRVLNRCEGRGGAPLLGRGGPQPTSWHTRRTDARGGRRLKSGFEASIGAPLPLGRRLVPLRQVDPESVTLHASPRPRDLRASPRGAQASRGASAQTVGWRGSGVSPGDMFHNQSLESGSRRIWAESPPCCGVDAGAAPPDDPRARATEPGPGLPSLQSGGSGRGGN